MKKVVLFKSESEEYRKVFTDNNYETIFIEPLKFTFTNLEELNVKLQQNHYDGIIFTSGRAIEAVSKCWDPSNFVIWNTKRIYTVGETSSRNIKLSLGLEVLGATSGNAENLAKIILSENPGASKFLFPIGNLTLETLPRLLLSKGITVDSIAVYDTAEHDNLKSELVKLNEQSDVSCMVYFSPSGCEFIHRQLQTFDNNLFQLPHFAIGISTAKKMEYFGLQVAGVAAKPRPDSVMESIHKYYKSVKT